MPPLGKVLLVDGLSTNLINISQTCDEGLDVKFQKSNVLSMRMGWGILLETDLVMISILLLPLLPLILFVFHLQNYGINGLVTQTTGTCRSWSKMKLLWGYLRFWTIKFKFVMFAKFERRLMNHTSQFRRLPLKKSWIFFTWI